MLRCKSRMRRESHVRFREGVGVKFPHATRPVLGFQHEAEAKQFWALLAERFAKFGLELHPAKTRLLEIGRRAAEDRKRNGRGKSESFDFLGFTHVCGKTRKGLFTVLRQTSRKRVQKKLSAIKIELRSRLHVPVPEVGKWLGTVLRGHFNYYGVPRNVAALGAFRFFVIGLWCRSLRRRSQKTRMTWERTRIALRYLPPVRVTHPFPDVRFHLIT
jgi:hypothetical protein